MYQIVPDPATIRQVAALPDGALDAYAEVLVVLQLTPWNGRAQHEGNPDGAVRRWTFGAGQVGQVVYLIDEQRQEVHLCSCNGVADCGSDRTPPRLSGGDP
ncbi:MAG: hypothetical protein ACRDST_03940 [Pseudonocardiaceae bacterium]